MMIHRSIITALVLGVPFALLTPQGREIELRAADGTLLRGTYFAAGRPGPAVMLSKSRSRPNPPRKLLALVT